LSTEPKRDDRPAAGSRLPYEKPAIEFVETHADEVLGITCKAVDTSLASGTLAGGCLAVSCTDNGS
jgi:hypothetical protein